MFYIYLYITINIPAFSFCCSWTFARIWIRLWLFLVSCPSPPPLQDCCGNCSDSDEEPTRLWRRGLAQAPPPCHRRISFCLQLLHICIFRIALYKHWNVYFHYIAMRTVLFKVNATGKKPQRISAPPSQPRISEPANVDTKAERPKRPCPIRSACHRLLAPSVFCFLILFLFFL